MLGLDDAVPQYHQAHQVIGATPGHEVVHLLSTQSWGPAGSAMASEGLAVYRSRAFDHHYKPIIAGRPRLCRVSPWAFNDSDAHYLIASAWFALLDARFGREAVKELCLSTDPASVISDHPGSEAQAALCRWIEDLPDCIGTRRSLARRRLTAHPPPFATRGSRWGPVALAPAVSWAHGYVAALFLPRSWTGGGLFRTIESTPACA